MAAAVRKAICNFNGQNMLISNSKWHFNSVLPCCSFANYVGKTASGMMRSNDRRSSRRDTGGEGSRGGPRDRKRAGPSKAMLLDPDKVDWPSAFSSAQSYNPAQVPVMVRMGRPRHNRLGKLPNRAIGNIELLKIPNFFHLAPTAIERHCEALKQLCKPWPTSFDQSTRPIQVTSRNYLLAGPSLYHPRSRTVKIQISLKSLILDEHARHKLIQLVGPRYDTETDILTIVASKCPTRKQNKDYALYLLTVLYNEAWKTEPWENEAISDLNEEQGEEEQKATKKGSHRKRLKIIDDELYRINKYGKAFKLHIKTKV